MLKGKFVGLESKSVLLFNLFRIYTDLYKIITKVLEALFKADHRSLYR